MNTIDKKLKTVKEFINEDAILDPSALESFANSKKVYIQGSTPDIQVPFREITISDTPSEFGAEKNVPVLVYDTSGPYTDPKQDINIQNGLFALRGKWIEDRKDTEVLDGPSSDFGKQRKTDPELENMRFNLLRKPKKAKSGQNVSQMHYAKKGIITPEMEFIAIRENQRREGLSDVIQEQHKVETYDAI